MLSRDDLDVAVFIGGMKGILEEYELFTGLHPRSKIEAVPALGRAAKDLAMQLQTTEAELGAVDFLDLFWRTLEISPGGEMDLNPEFSGCFGNGFRLRSGLLDRSKARVEQDEAPHTCTAETLLPAVIHNLVEN